MKSWLVLSAITGTVAMLAACEEKIYPPPIVSLLPQASATGAPCTSASVARTVPPPRCEGKCCPTAQECYGPFGNPGMHSGAECLAKRENTNQQRWQFRQTFSISTAPAGLVAAPFPDVLAHRAELLSANCGAPMGTSGFMQLIDFDTAARVSRTGFARFVLNESDAVASQLCMVADDAYTTDHALPALYQPTNWPPGLPPPMAMPWKVAPSIAVQLDSDFTLPDQRQALLGRLATGGDLAGNGGIFYFDRTRGYMHAFSPLTYIVNYDNATSLVIVPIREAEMTQWLNDPAYPNCAGSFLGDGPAGQDTCVGGGTNRIWGCPAGNCLPDELAPTKIQGYFLIAEVEQVFSAIGQTLCVLFGRYPDWPTPDNKTCRSNPSWNAMDPVKGLPAWDWCAATNQPASGDCHDALQSVSFSTFQAFPIRDGTCAPL